MEYFQTLRICQTPRYLFLKHPYPAAGYLDTAFSIQVIQLLGWIRAATILFPTIRFRSRYKGHDTIHDTIHYCPRQNYNLYPNGKDLNYVSRHTDFYTHNHFLKIVKYIWLGKVAWCFRRLLSYPKMERGEAKPFVTSTTQISGIGHRPKCTGVREDTEIIPYSCVRPFC